MKRTIAISFAMLTLSGCARAPMIVPSLPQEAKAAPMASSIPSNCTTPAISANKKGQLSARDVAGYVVGAGFPASEVTTAVAVAMAESSHDPRATNLNANGSTDYGLFQINSIHQSVLAQGDKFNPADNAKMAFKIWKQAGGRWSPWAAYNAGRHRKYMDMTKNLPDPASCTPAVPAMGNKAGCGKPGADLSKFGNGSIPSTYLCPLWANPAQKLRPDAAQSFDKLSQAYVKRFGTKPCITDSYRSYELQVDVKRRKPSLAAKPGTSNHGWGRALDMCGGLQTFGTPQHNWMRENAPKYGWRDPDWAKAGGSKPEPWHWEFGTKN